MNRIKEVRESKNISRATLHRLSGVPIRTLEAWEADVNIPRDVYQIKKVADALGCKIEDIIDFEDGI